MIIMVVDDEKDVEMLFRQKFRKEIRTGRLKFHFAFSGEEAIQYLETNGTTDLVLILSDINMPGMNGLELLQKIKADHENLPVYMITAYGDDKTFQQAQDFGCDDFLTKPLNFSELKEKMLKAA